MSCPSNIVTEQTTTCIVEVITAGPQGPPGPAGSGGTVDVSAAVNKSLVYYDSATSTLKANAIWTTDTITDGGNF